MDDPTHLAPIEPTVPVSNPYQDEEPIGIPPPPPHALKKKRSPALLVMLLIIAVLLFGASGLFYLARTSTVTERSKPTPVVKEAPSTARPSGTPTVLLNRTPASHQGASFPAFLTSYSSPPADLAYSSMTVFNYLLDTGSRMLYVDHSDGWACCVASQPEGKIVSWEESYAVVVEVATFKTPTEAETDANDLRINSSGYSVVARNLCLLFYDNSISNTTLAHYLSALAAVCT